MSLSNISRALLNTLLPDGIPWNPEKDGDFDRFLDGLSLCLEDVRIYLEQLGYVRDPYNIPVELLPDLEKEYGIITKTNISEETRRMQLAAKIFTRDSNGSVDDLEGALRAAGFDVYVHSNSPAVNPQNFLNLNFQVTIGDPVTAYLGDPNAYFGRAGGYLLVNGRDENYSTPLDSDTWPFIFFVGGPAARGVLGQLAIIVRAEIPSERQAEFEKIILQYKPVFTWAGLVVTYV